MNEKWESYLGKKKKKNPNRNPIYVVSVTHVLEEVMQLTSE